MPENTLIIEDIVGSIRQLVCTITDDSAEMDRQFNLTASQRGVLRNLSVFGPISSAQLSRKLCVTPSNITGVIDRLVKKGLVRRKRQQSDRRVTLICLTDSGEALSRRLPPPIVTRLTSELSGLDDQRIARLRDALHLLLGLVESDKNPPIRFTDTACRRPIDGSGRA